MHQIVRAEFKRFKAFKSFSLDLRHFNILVGPNNAGKSTVLTAFRILAAAVRKASSRKAKPVKGPTGVVPGYDIDLSSISVAAENIFYNYQDDEPATITFRLSNQNSLTLCFPESGACFLIPDAQGKAFSTPSTFQNQFDCPIGFVPILGPVEHSEPLYEKEAARLALFNYRAARNFRNIWFHYPEKFGEFRTALTQTWPGMDIERPEIDRTHERPRLNMFCPEQRIPRELFWSGFGFQVWCQMLTHIIQADTSSLFLIDEPDIYLHADLQRQLLSLLRNLGPDILIATHSTEIITEAETDDIVLIHKSRSTARRIKNPSQLEEVFSILGSNLNPVLTQLAKSRRVLFVEGKDFQILGKFARKVGSLNVGNRRDFAVVPVEGFNPERIRNLKAGMETTLGSKIVAAAILDRDYRCDEECNDVIKQCRDFCDYVSVLRRKEIENFVLCPDVIDRAAGSRVSDHAKRSNKTQSYSACAAAVLDEFCDKKKTYIASQRIAEQRRHERLVSSKRHETEIGQEALESFEATWRDPKRRLDLIPGKDALGALNAHLQDKFGVSVTVTSIIDAMRQDEIPSEMRELILTLEEFSKKSPT